MKKIGIYFGTDTGTTRLIAKKIAKKLGDIVDKPLNINRTDVEAFLNHDALILGTPTYGIDQLPGKSTDIEAGSWEEFLPDIDVIDFTGKTIALYGLGDQEKYSDRFLDSMIHLYRFFSERGATMVGQWPLEGYQFDQSMAVLDG
ncbi:MAG: flavodoxin, partial [Zetaproteobacteria bacterium CG02_land_8_20_14_3_00_50_9]